MILAKFRDELRPIYKLAWAERDTGLGNPIWVRLGKTDRFRLKGVYLDLQLRYTEERRLMITGPTPLGPADYIRAVGTQHRRQYIRDPIPLSELADDVVRLAEDVPEFKRGRR